MKKILIFLLSVLLVVSSVLLVACNAKVVSLKIEGAPKEVVRNSEINYGQISVVVEYDDGAKNTLKLTDNGVEYTAIDTSTTGSKTLTVTYGGQSAQATITVVEGQIDDEDVIIIQYDNTRGYKEYLEAIKEQTNKETEFVNREVLYTVGNANGYKLLPQVVADVDGEEVVLAEVTTSFKLYHRENGTYVEVGENNLDRWLVKAEKNIYYFNQEAEGEVFKIEVSLDESYETIIDVTTITQEFRVVNGYNAYDALGLSVLDNRNINAWAGIKDTVLEWDNGKKLSEYTDVLQVVLHNNVTVTANDLPDSYFWKETDVALQEGSVSYADALNRSPENLRNYLKGSLKEVYLGEDWEEDDSHQRGIYLSDGIGLSGNFLKLDYESGLTEDGKPGEKGIYVVYDFNKRQNDGKTYPEAHYSLISYRHEGIDEADIKGTRTIENVYFVGQTQKTENNALPAGLMMVASNIADLKIVNTIGSSWFCNATLDGVAVGSITIEKCKFYDSFSQMVFSWGAKAVTIYESEMKRAGGPLLILQTRTGSTNRESVITIDDTSKMESWLTGAEMWFQINNLPDSIVSQLLTVATVSDIFAGTHYKVDGKTNLIAVMIPDAGDVFTNQNAIPGTLTIGEYSYGMDEPVFNGLLTVSSVAASGITLADATTQAIGTNDGVAQLKAGFEQLQPATAALAIAPIFKCGNAYGYFDGAALNSLATLTANVQLLYGGAMQVQQQLEAVATQYEAGGMVEQAQALKGLADQWAQLAANLQALGTLSVDQDSWSSSWTAGQQAVWVNPGGLDASNPNFNLKHFLVLIGEGQVA